MAFKKVNVQRLIENPVMYAQWLQEVIADSLNIPAAAEKAALAGAGATPPSGSNKYVVEDSTTNPTAGEKAALAGTSGAPSASNKYVTNQDPRLGFAARGTFTLDAAAATVVPETAVTADCSIGLPTPLNAAAATLMGSAQHLYVDPADYVVGVSFTVRTGDGTPAAGTEQFGYRVFTG